MTLVTETRGQRIRGWVGAYKAAHPILDDGQKFSQNKLARQIKVDPAWFSRVLRDEIDDPKFKYLARVLAFFEKDLSDLDGCVVPPTPTPATFDPDPEAGDVIALLCAEAARRGATDGAIASTLGRFRKGSEGITQENLVESMLAATADEKGKAITSPLAPEPTRGRRKETPPIKAGLAEGKRKKKAKGEEKDKPNNDL